jgi:prolyl oligopeptidase PreP (S9A serine peptidase family)
MTGNLLAEDTNSEKLKSFNVDSKERQLFVSEQHARLNLRLKQSLNFKKMKAKVLSYGSEFVVARRNGNDGKIYTMYDRGVGKANELVETAADGSTKVIFTSLSLSRNNKYNALSMSLNPSKNKAVLLFSHKGSTDGFKILTIDLTTNQIIYQSADNAYFGQAGAGVFFKDDFTIITENNDGSTNRIISRSIVNDSAPKLLLENAEIYENQGDLLLAVNPAEEIFIITAEKIYGLGKQQNFKIFSTSSASINFHTSVTDASGTVASFFVYAFKTEKSTKLFETNFMPTSINMLPHLIVFELSQGFKKTLYAYSDDGKKISTIEVPFCCQVAGLDEQGTDISVKVESITLTLKSPVNSKEFSWDLSVANPAFPADFAQSMLESTALSLVVEERFAKSFDGTMIPYRVVYKKGLEPVNKPVYMEAYGGFNISGYLDNNLNVYNKDFINHGGVYVGPGLRGGNEFGDAWHDAAIKENKYKTFEDLASVAKALIESSVTSREKIIIAGSSNGGLTVAATALLYPQYIGLAIPHNGVLDMLDKEELDPRFDFGWSYEYGDSRIESEFAFLQKYSPLELMTKVVNPPNILILNGRTDTRVNTAHSIKLAAAAKLAGHNNVELAALNNSGHFNASLGMSDYIAWRLMSIKWSTIYDFLKIEY